MPLLTDQTGRTFTYQHSPKRIVSLVPSQTELLAYLQLDQQVVGITKFCLHPHHWWRSKKRVGGTKNVSTEQVLSLKPDLVLANKEENVAEQVLELAAEIPTYVSDVNSLPDAVQMVSDVGLLTGMEESAAILNKSIILGFDQLGTAKNKKRAVYFIWKDPWMASGCDTFIHSMMEAAGFENVLGQSQRYPIVDLRSLAGLQPEVLLLSSEPYPFKEEHKTQLQQLFPNVHIEIVDGEMFSWYGSRLLQVPNYFAGLRKKLSLL